MGIRNALDVVSQLDLPPGPVLSGETELRWVEDIPGLGGKLHPVAVLPDGVDPQPVTCGALFEGSHPDAGPVDGSRLLALLSEGRLCTVCADRLSTVNEKYLALADQVVLRAVSAAAEAEALQEAVTKDPALDLDPAVLATMEFVQSRFGALVDDARTVEGFDVLEDRVSAAREAYEVAFLAALDVLRGRPDLAEVIAAIDADRAKRPVV